MKVSYFTIYYGRRVTYLILKLEQPREIPKEPLKLMYTYENSLCRVKLQFLSGLYLEFEMFDNEKILNNSDDLYIEVYVGTRIYRFKSCYKSGNVWYIDYIGPI